MFKTKTQEISAVLQYPCPKCHNDRGAAKTPLHCITPYGLVGSVTISHTRGSHLKPSCGHWNL